MRREATLPNPQYILQNTHESVKYIDLLADLIYEDKDLPFHWLCQVSLSNSDISNLIDQHNNRLEDLLRYLGRRSSISTWDDSKLHTSYIQRVLKVIRIANDHHILRGALIALSSSKFLRLAGTNLCLKMIQADTSAAIYTRKIFRKASDEIQSEERRILNEIANEIMSSSNNYSFRANTIAANYLAESIQISLPALLSLEEELKIRIFK